MNLADCIDRGAALQPDRCCFLHADTGERWSYAEIRDVSHRVAVGLARRGVGIGDCVAMLGGNHPLSFAGMLGIVRSGASYVPLNPRSRVPEFVQILRQTKPKVLMYDGDLSTVVDAIVEEAGQALGCVALRGTVRIGDESLTESVAEGEQFDGRRTDAEQPAWIVSTGGTTGSPKAVVLSHRALMTQTLGLLAHLPERHPVQMVAAPLTHAAGGLTLPVLMQGGTTVVHQGVDVARILRGIAEHQITRLYLPPTAIYSMLSHPDVEAHDFSSLRYFLYGSAPMSVSKLREARRVFGPVMAQFFGQSELPTICTFMSPEDHEEAFDDPGKASRLASAGRESYVAQVAVQGPDGKALGPGEVGEIVVRSELRMTGYLGQPNKSAETDRGAGWRGTSDLGRIDEDGFVYIVDRMRDVIITGGFNVYPNEVERVLLADPGVRDCAVVGTPDDHWGEAVTAVVELVDGATVSEERLIEACKRELGSIKAPKRVIFRDLPRSTVGKVLKKDLRAEFWASSGRVI